MLLAPRVHLLNDGHYTTGDVAAVDGYRPLRPMSSQGVHTTTMSRQLQRRRNQQLRFEKLSLDTTDLFRRRDYMPSRPRQPRRVLLIWVRLTRAPHKLIKAMPQRSDGVVFFGHPEDLFELSVEDVG